MSASFLRPWQQSARLCSRQMLWRRYASGTAESIEAPMLSRLRAELKTAMKAKDRERLNVIKGVLANITNAEKMNQPMDSDEKIRRHLLKQAETQRNTAQQFEAGNRNDLRDKELAQASILEGYASEVKVVPEDVLKEAISGAINALTSEGKTGNVGSIVQALRRKDGPLLGQIFDSDQAMRIMKDLGIVGPGSKKT